MKNAHLRLSQVATDWEERLILRPDECFISLAVLLYDARRDCKSDSVGANSPVIFRRYTLEAVCANNYPFPDQCPELSTIYDQELHMLTVASCRRRLHAESYAHSANTFFRMNYATLRNEFLAAAISVDDRQLVGAQLPLLFMGKQVD